jgi:hypothetical protein
MGEYAKYQGAEIKIGTCESMYYLRADQAHLVEPLHGNVDPINDAEHLRFRFPFPDEDGIEPGHFDDYNRGVRIPGWSLPDDFEGHGSVQFTASAGYVLSVPCPEQFGTHGFGPVDVEGVAVHRNGFNGHPVVRQQRMVDGILTVVVACGACGAAWRLPTLEDAAPVIEAFRAEAEREEWHHNEVGYSVREPAHGEQHRTFLLDMAARIFAGYCVGPREVIAH